MTLRASGARALCLAAALSVVAGVLVGADAAVAVSLSCPKVDPTTHVVSPAPTPGVDWSGCILTFADLHGADLAGANLSGANLNAANLAGANLAGTALDGATMIGLTSGGIAGTPATLPANTSMVSGYIVGPHVSLRGADLNRADLAGADLTGVSSGGITGTPSSLPPNWSLVSGYLIGPGASLAGANLAGADLIGADLTYASDLTLTDLTNANLSGANLTNANLMSAVLAGANLKGANLDNTSLSAAIMSGVSSGGVTGSPASLPAKWQLWRGYLIGDGANLSGADLTGIDLPNVTMSLNLTGANLTNANFSGAFLSSSAMARANLQSTDLAGAVLQFVSSGGITGTPMALPANWSLKDGYLIGPLAYLKNAVLTGADLSGADLVNANASGASLSGADLTGAAMTRVDLQGADLTGADLGGDTLAYANLSGATMKDVGLAHADLDHADANNAVFTGASLAGANLTSAAASSANFNRATLNGADLTSVALTFSTLDGANLTGANLTGASAFGASFTGAIWSNTTCPDGSNSDKYTDGCFSQLDTTPPTVSVTGVRAGGRYVLGAVPAPGCATTDDSMVAVPASLTVTTTGSKGVGPFTATCAGAVDRAGNVQAAPVRASYNVLYRFGGFITPRAGSTVAKSAGTVTVRFQLTNPAGRPIASSIASPLAAAHRVQASLTGPGIKKPALSACGWNTSTRVFRCVIKIPAGVKTGNATRYLITAIENLGAGFLPAPKVGKAVNPEVIHFS